LARKKTSLLLERLEITDIAAEGKSLARMDNMVVFVPHTIPGDIVDVQVTKKRKRYMEGYPVFFHRHSSMRAEPFCAHFGECGGCRWQHLPYPEQLKYKEKQVTDQFERIGRIPIGEKLPILASGQNTNYRNKLEFTFSNSRWLTREEVQLGSEATQRKALGFHIPGRFDKVLAIEKCHLQPEPSNQIRNFIRDYALQNDLPFFDLRGQQGFLRNLIIRNNRAGDFMVVLSFFSHEKQWIDPLMEAIMRAFPQVVSLFYVVNPKANDTITDLRLVLCHGKDHLTESMDGLTFRIGPKSFYQTNPAQAQRLYATALEFAALRGHENVFDIYCGTGTIALYVARHCAWVTGIESVAEAIEDARENALLNGIQNASFHAGDSRLILQPSFIEETGRPDVIMVDPPRSGMHEDVVKAILGCMPERVVYISCNPATQARDIQLMADRYRVTRLQPVDMFPHTYHVENVALLERI
jgi:23S rRNA (uracil1939-C5)-methyltransferase